MIQAVVESAPGLTLAQLCQRTQPVVTSDTINLLIAAAEVDVDLHAFVLAEPE